MRHSTARILVSLFLVSMSVPAFAVPITYIYTGSNASGSLGGVDFTNADFTVTALADTDNIGSWCCSAGQNTHLSATIDIDGFSVATILTASHSWYDNATVGLGENLGANWMTFHDPALSGYDLATSIGPVFATAFNVDQFHNVLTSAGTLNFSGSTLQGSFQAITVAVPEPGTLALLVFGVAGIGLARRRKKV